MNKQRIVIVSAAGAGMLGTFLPWGTFGIISVDGTRGDGWVTLVVYVIALVIALVGKRKEQLTGGQRFSIVLLSAIAELVAVYDMSRLSNADISTGSGLMLVILAGLVICIVTSLGGHWIQPVLLSAAITIVVLAGFFHVVYNVDNSPHLCPKQHWSLTATFVDLQSYLGTSTGKDASVIRALNECDLITITKPEPRSYGACFAAGREGICMDTADCDGIAYTQHCVGPDNIRCCVR